MPISVSGSHSKQCSNARLESMDNCIRIPTDEPYDKNITTDKTVQREIDSDRPTLASKRLVHPSEGDSPKANEDRILHIISGDGRQQPPSQKPGLLESTRLVYLKTLLKKDLSNEAANVLAHRHAESIHLGNTKAAIQKIENLCEGSKSQYFDPFSSGGLVHTPKK